MLKSKSSQQGFTLTEVLVSILITTIFVAVAMQAIVLAAVMSLKAKQSAEATTWIQKDLESVKYQASLNQLPYNSNACDSGYGASLNDTLEDPEPTDKTLVNKRFWIQRETIPNENILGIIYRIVPDNNGSPGSSDDAITTIYTEVIPDAAFQCP